MTIRPLGKNKTHVPLRTCISCLKRREKNELIRLTLDNEGRLVRDDNANNQGRGAYVCRENACLEALKKKKNICRTFRVEGRVLVHPDFRFEAE